MKTLFDLGSEQQVSTSQVLLLEAGTGHCCYALADTGSRRIAALKYMETDAFGLTDVVERTMQELRGMTFARTVACISMPYALLVPDHLSRPGNSVNSFFFDLPDQEFLHDEIREWQVTNSYSVSRKLYRMITGTWPSVQFLHAYTPELKVYNGFDGADQVSVLFHPHHFTVIVKKAGHLQLAQMYAYQTPMDVTYYLLKICYEFRINQSKADLVVSGLVEKDSALYRELHHYFLNIHFRQSDFRLPSDAYPDHFFASLLNLAACVS